MRGIRNLLFNNETEQWDLSIIICVIFMYRNKREARKMRDS